jgi:hypothetical protein
MVQTASLVFAGTSGKRYTFVVYPLYTAFNNVGAVYGFIRTTSDFWGQPVHSAVYIGQTGELGTRLSNHHKWECIKAQGANRVCVLRVDSELMRLSIEADLCMNYKPPCNDLLKSVR